MKPVVHELGLFQFLLNQECLWCNGYSSWKSDLKIFGSCPAFVKTLGFLFYRIRLRLLNELDYSISEKKISNWPTGSAYFLSIISDQSYQKFPNVSKINLMESLAKV